MELNQLAANEGVLVLNEIAVIICLSKGLKTKMPIVNVIKHLRIEDCGFWSDVEHPYSPGPGLSYHTSLGDMRPT